MIVLGQRKQQEKDFFCPGTKGQRDKLKILPQDGTGWDFETVPSGPGTFPDTKSPSILPINAILRIKISKKFQVGSKVGILIIDQKVGMAPQL